MMATYQRPGQISVIKWKSNYVWYLYATSACLYSFVTMKREKKDWYMQCMSKYDQQHPIVTVVYFKLLGK